LTDGEWNIDFNHSHFVIGPNIPPHRQVETPKTAASERKVDMSPELAGELKQLLVERKKQAAQPGRASPIITLRIYSYWILGYETDYNGYARQKRKCKQSASTGCREGFWKHRVAVKH
jgi:hypothetical protein